MTFWRCFFTSRYTLSLEERVNELKAAIDQKDAEILRLNIELAARGRMQAVTPAVANGTSGTQPQQRIMPRREQEVPRAGNWLKAQSQLELGTDERHERFEPGIQERQRRTKNSHSEE